MKFLWFNVETKKELRAKNAILEKDLEDAETDIEELIQELAHYKTTFPLTLGDTVCDIQLRNANGRFAKRNASRQHSYYNKVVVTKSNYFSLVDRFLKKDVFINEFEANKYLDEVCN